MDFAKQVGPGGHGGQLDQHHQQIPQQLQHQQQLKQQGLRRQRDGTEPQQGQAERHQHPQPLATGKVEGNPAKFWVQQGQQPQQLLGVASPDPLAPRRFQRGIRYFQLQCGAAIVIHSPVTLGDGLHRQDEVIVDGIGGQRGEALPAHDVKGPMGPQHAA
ncbi:hypothetical protein D3C77_588580 [compost metagenome]